LFQEKPGGDKTPEGNGDKTLAVLAGYFMSESKIRKLNLGCGPTILSGYVNCDMVALPGVDKVFSLNDYPWPFEAGTVDEVLMDNVLEHLPDTVRVVREVHRILKPGGKYIAIVPYFASEGAFNDPTHIRYFGPQSMDLFAASNSCWYSEVKFSKVHVSMFNKDMSRLGWLRNRLMPFKFLLRRLIWNVYDYIRFELTK
jgi:SAM-dependent methyltransferase